MSLIGGMFGYAERSVSPPSGGTPNAPTNIIATAGTTSAEVLWQASTAPGSSQLTKYVITANPGGIQAFSPTNLTTPVVSNPSCKGYVEGLTAGTPYTFTVAGINSSGTGTASVASNSVTPTALANYYVANGGGVVGRNTAWGDVSFGLSSVDWASTDVVPLSGTTSVKAVLLSGQFGGLLPFKINSLGSGNGRFDLAPYTNITLAFQPTVASYHAEVYFEQSIWINGVMTTGGSTTFSDAAQAWTTNQFASNGWLYNNISTASTQNTISANTATQITAGTGSGFTIGNYYELQQPDLGNGNAVPIGAGSSLYGPATMTANAWNTYTIPISAFNLTNLQVLKFAIHDQTGGSSTFYVCNLGFT